MMVHVAWAGIRGSRGMHNLILMALVAGLAASPTMALAEESTPAGVADWSGAYIGLSAGAGWSSTSIRDGGTATPPSPPYGAFACAVSLLGNYCNRPFELDSSGFLGAIQFGGNLQRGNWVYGIEVDVGWADIDETKHLIYPTSPNQDSDIASVDYGVFFTLTGRLGYAIDKSLFYVKGGLAGADIEISAADLDRGAIYPGSVTRDSGLEGGWTLGGGWEYMLSQKVSIKAEYLYMDFGSSVSYSPDGDIYKTDHELHTARVGFNLHTN